jgi:hypothetical protein
VGGHVGVRSNCDRVAVSPSSAAAEGDRFTAGLSLDEPSVKGVEVGPTGHVRAGHRQGTSGAVAHLWTARAEPFGLNPPTRGQRNHLSDY